LNKPISSYSCVLMTVLPVIAPLCFAFIWIRAFDSTAHHPRISRIALSMPPADTFMELKFVLRIDMQDMQCTARVNTYRPLVSRLSDF